MGLFKKRTPTPARPSVPPMGSGRRLRSSLSVPAGLALLEELLLSYRAPKYTHLPSYVTAAYTWNVPTEEPPATVVSFSDGNDDFILAAFWPEGSGSELVLFPLGAGDERLQTMPLIGNWKMRDRSLSSIGTAPHGMLTLRAPRITDELFEGTVAAGGYPVTAANVQSVGLKFGEMFLIKAYEFLSATQGPQAYERFAAAHRYPGGPTAPFCQAILDDLVAAEPGLVPYLQELPMRIRAIMLESRDGEDPFANVLQR